jgi:hypothetical protein
MDGGRKGMLIAFVKGGECNLMLLFVCRGLMRKKYGTFGDLHGISWIVGFK